MKRQATRFFTLVAAAPLAASVLVSNAHAVGAAPEGAAEAITKYQDDTVTTAGLVISAGIVVWGLFKLGRKFGWF